MPEIDALFGISFHIYYFDNQRHKLPHLHAKYGEYELVLAIEKIECLDGFLPQKQRKIAEKYILENQKNLMYMWNKAIKGEYIGKLEDLC